MRLHFESLRAFFFSTCSVFVLKYIHGLGIWKKNSDAKDKNVSFAFFRAAPKSEVSFVPFPIVGSIQNFGEAIHSLTVVNSTGLPAPREQLE